MRRRGCAWAGEGTVSPVVTTVLPLAEAAQAHRASESLTTAGKIVLLVPDH